MIARMMYAICAPRSVKSIGRIAEMMPRPISETLPTSSMITSAAPQLAWREVQVEEQPHHRKLHHRQHDAVEQREDADAEHVCQPRDRRHEGVLDGAFPALDGHRLGDAVEDDADIYVQIAVPMAR